MIQAIYKVSTWDHEKQRWRAYVTRTRKWGLRKILRSLYRHGCTPLVTYRSNLKGTFWTRTLENFTQLMGDYHMIPRFRRVEE